MNDKPPYVLIEHPHALEIIIAAPRKASHIASRMIILFVWVCIAMILLPFVAGILFPAAKIVNASPATKIFLAAWFIAWLPMGAILFAFALWIAASREVITIDADTFTIRREIMRFHTTKTYATARVRCLQPAPTNRRRLGNLSGAIGFAYQRQPVTWGTMLKEEDAEKLVKAILRRFPRLGECSLEDTPEDSPKDTA